MHIRRAVLRMIGAGLTGAALVRWPAVANAQHGHGDHGTTMPPAGNADVLIFAAATLKPALDEIVAAYASTDQTKIRVAYGPTPFLAKNIVDGAPADVFFSADAAWMDHLAERKLIRRHTRFDVVGNDVVLVESAKAAAAPVGEITSSFPIAAVVGAGPLAMCNPESHPAGRFGRTSLEQLGLWDAVASKVAIVENPQVAAAMVARGDVPAAVVFATDIHGLSGVRIAGKFPDSSHARIAYPVAVTMSAPHPMKAEAFVAYLRTAPARQVFDRFGYRQAP
jgi:molybdate transport system substrate-binding protein